MSYDVKNHANNILIGQGALYVGLDGAAHERYLGDAVSASLSISEERIVVTAGTGPERKLIDRPRSVERTVTVTLRDVSMENLALFLGTGEVVAAKEGDAVADEEITVSPGRWYALKAARGGKVRDVAVSKGKGGDADAWTGGTHYEEDLERGRILILSPAEGAIPDGTTVHVDYTPVPGARIEAGTAKDVTGALRYIEHPLHDDMAGRHYYAPRCAIRPAGDLGLMGNRDTEQQIVLACEILAPEGGGAALCIDGEAS